MTAGRRRMILWSVAGLGFLAALFVEEFRYILADPSLYRERVITIAAGRLPYLDAEFEHLPVMLIPMFGVWLLGGFQSRFAFGLLWVTVMAVTLVAVLRMIEKAEMGEPRMHGWADRWLMVSLPLIPLVVFRNEPVVVWLAVVGMTALMGENFRRASWAIVVGSLAKGWPLVLSLPLWRLSRRAALIVSTLATVGLLVVAITPGFASGRSYNGVHSETLGGSVAGLVAAIAGAEVELIAVAGATYVEAPIGVAALGAVAGAVIAIRALGRWRGSDRAEVWVPVVGALVVAMLLAAPLQSTQFLFWLTPFAAFRRDLTTQSIMVLIGVLGLFGIVRIDLLLVGIPSPGWFAAVVLRNVLLIALGWRLGTQPELNQPVVNPAG